MKEFFANQIAMALMLFAIIAIGSLIVIGVDADQIIIQIITATGALVTGVAIGRTPGMNQRSTDTVTNITESVKKEDKVDEKI